MNYTAAGRTDPAPRVLRRHAGAGDEFTGLPLCDLARRAATLPETLRGQVDAAFGSDNIEEALRQILRAASSSATQVAAEEESEEADPEEDDTSDKDDAMASLNAMMASELRKASASATPAARAAHQATAQMIQVQIQAGGEKDGKGEKPRKAKSPSQMEFSMSKLEDALKAQDTVRVNRLLHSQTLDLENGQSQAMRELNAASLLAGEQGGSNQRYVPLVSRPPVAAPGAGFEGQRPLVDMDKLTKHRRPDSGHASGGQERVVVSLVTSVDGQRTDSARAWALRNIVTYCLTHMVHIGSIRPKQSLGL